MSTLLTYGSFSFPRETTLVPIALTFSHKSDGSRDRARRIWLVTTVLQVDSDGNAEANIKTATVALETALVDGRDLTLFQTDGETKTAHGTATNCRILSLRYPQPTGPELAVRRTAQVEFESITEVDVNKNVISFTETLTFSNGGFPRSVVQETIEGIAAGPFIVASNPKFLCVQSGQATGRLFWPAPAASRFPSFLIEAIDLPLSTARADNGDLRFVTRWMYRHESPTPISGFPATWDITEL